MRTRENRQHVIQNARMRIDGDWGSVTIRNVSSRGMLLWSEEPPRPGTYVEICGPATTLVARTVWVRGGYFGVRTQDRIDVESAIGGGRWRPVDPPSPEQRRAAGAEIATRLFASRHLGGVFEYGVAAVAVITVAALLAILLHSLLAQPLQAIADKLPG